jgi:hypothetical protein
VFVADLEGLFVEFDGLIGLAPAIVKMREEAVDADDEAVVGFAAFEGAKEGFAVEGLGFAEVAFLLTKIGEDADLFDEHTDARRVVISEPPRLLDTAGGGADLLLEGGVHLERRVDS